VKGTVALITILTDNVPAMLRFYRDVLGFQVKSNQGKYVEFENEGVRFAICSRLIMKSVTGHSSYRQTKTGQTFELAFPLDTPEEVDRVYADILAKGAMAVKAPATMSWGHRTAFFADPDGNIHELFAELPGMTER
jgi:catechol 2,3-dioxygenase-like lactoylglutathione lyase family enzyme